jgi:hypothetical protein
LNVACVAVPLLLERKRVAYTSNKKIKKWLIQVLILI